jgi:hypothetical protein
LNASQGDQDRGRAGNCPPFGSERPAQFSRPLRPSGSIVISDLEAPMTSAIPHLSDSQWSQIVELLPSNRRDPAMITALLFRETSGCGLRDVSRCFGVTRTRLSEWDQSLRDGTLLAIMTALGLVPATPLARRAGGPAWYANNPDLVAKIAALRLDQFRRELRSTGPSARRLPHPS